MLNIHFPKLSENELQAEVSIIVDCIVLGREVGFLFSHLSNILSGKSTIQIVHPSNGFEASCAFR